MVAKDPWRRLINHRTLSAPKGQNEIAQGRAKRRPGYGSAWVDAPRGSALSGLGRIRAHRTQGVALGYPLAPRWGKRPFDRVRWIILPRPVVAKDPWERPINHRTPTAPKGHKLDSPGQSKASPWVRCETGALDGSHWAILSAQILAVFEDGKRDITRISLRTGIETRVHLESTRKRALR